MPVFASTSSAMPLPLWSWSYRTNNSLGLTLLLLHFVRVFWTVQRRHFLGGGWGSWGLPNWQWRLQGSFRCKHRGFHSCLRGAQSSDRGRQHAVHRRRFSLPEAWSASAAYTGDTGRGTFHNRAGTRSGGRESLVEVDVSDRGSPWPSGQRNGQPWWWYPRSLQVWLSVVWLIQR